MNQLALSKQGVLNRIWSELILEELVRFGVQHVCIAPGSRSTPLTLGADNQSTLTIHTHFDERGLGFLALGMAKVSRSPVAIIVTSGTAAANLLPAIAEAKLTGEKLIILTADRPVELIGCGANQAIQQVGIYSEHVIGCLNLPSPSAHIPAVWLLSSIDTLMFQQQQTSGAVHVNCPFPEPLYSAKDRSIYDEYLIRLKKWQASNITYTQHIRDRSSEVNGIALLESRKGVIVVGNVDVSEAKKAKILAEVLGWPILCDPQSGVSSAWQHYDLWLRKKRCKTHLAECDLIVQFGARVVSKILNAFIAQQCSLTDTDYFLVCNEAQRLNPDHLSQTHILSDITMWINTQLIHQKGQNSVHRYWADDLKRYSTQVSELALGNETLTELNVANVIPKIVSKNDLFIGNSLIVRLFDMVTALQGNRTYSNRGASGIDGLVATAAGVLRMTNEPMLTVLGDTSLLYDLNSLALFSRVEKQNVILVTNNDGGAIFNLLSEPKEKKAILYQMPHGYQFKYAAKQFGLKYIQPDHMDELICVAREHLDSGKGTLLIELVTPAVQVSKDIEELVRKVDALR